MGRSRPQHRAYSAIDADGHILEPLDLWDKYIDPGFRDSRPRFRRGGDGRFARFMFLGCLRERKVI